MLRFLSISSKSKRPRNPISKISSSSIQDIASKPCCRQTHLCNSTNTSIFPSVQPPNFTSPISSNHFFPSGVSPKVSNFTNSIPNANGVSLFCHSAGESRSFCRPISANRFFSSGISLIRTNSRNPIQNRAALLRVQSSVGEPRNFSSESDRESINYDVVIVGAGPAGLSAAIRMKQLCREKDVDLSVCVVEKGAEVGAHILSGNVFEPRALDELLPQWRQDEAPINIPVSSDKFCLLTKDRSFSLPCPFDNKGNYVISLSQLVRWMGTKAEDLGVEIYPGFAASEILYDANHEVVGIGTNDMGVAKDGSKRENFQHGVELKGRITLLSEGCRGSLSEKIMRDYKLREKLQAQHQTYALGIKEVWEIDEGKHKPGSVLHTLGWPLDHKTYGGSFLYHMKDRQVSIGLVVALDYRNPFLNPYEEFQKLKHHPAIKPLLEGGTVLQYGARTLNEGGYQSIPYPVFPGGAIIGCSAGFLNVPKIKGTHTAMKSGMLAAEAAFGVLHKGSSMETYWDNLRSSWIWEELHRARNYRPAFDYGLIPGLALSALEHYILKGRLPLTLKHGKPDHEATDVASLHTPIQYPKPDSFLSFDVPTSLYRSNTNHEHDQPPHLRLRDTTIPELINLPEYAGPESRYCPARVYEYVSDEKGQPKLHINAQNCLHCKACDIKDPKQNIEWTVPEGGGGPGGHANLLCIVPILSDVSEETQYVAADAAEADVTVVAAVAAENEFGAVETGVQQEGVALHCCWDRTADWIQRTNRSSSWAHRWEGLVQSSVSKPEPPLSVHHLALLGKNN
ncbi:hypothetical protein HHK36_013314 [Tetracentron sinense]|uniref:Electron transfer flavoprotein-ubiquinone oxidoreductase, mitochondrial n=1 Tax=Tetracentron sinense TaxID=13715 RepID=A0A834ZAG0_TETSI|nr:hypothetical protein HHK36_013314 [Tetracentron sinense]